MYDAAVAQARLPVFYTDYGVADTLDGRFEMVVLHVTPLIDGLRDEGGSLLPEGQALFDHFLSDMDQNLRTIGVGDLSIPKKMKKVGAAFYGRFDAYRRAMDDGDALAAACARNVLDAPDRPTSPEARALARYMRALRDAAPGKLTPSPHFPDPARFVPDGAAVEAEGAAA
ncbi:ubiquinol-cytochrome C chaperone family protein [Acuticoccus sp.]|uniref:ubiquinol-cytochrome C chaperone family protein n=1 Tax=Acuticoccus sp. TaxID=1904378 RepID=UPI003B52751E